MEHNAYDCEVLQFTLKGYATLQHKLLVATVVFALHRTVLYFSCTSNGLPQLYRAHVTGLT